MKNKSELLNELEIKLNKHMGESISLSHFIHKLINFYNDEISDLKFEIEKLKEDKNDTKRS